MAVISKQASFGYAAASSGFGAAEFFANILEPGINNSWELNLPPRLRDHQPEIETLLSRVFSDRPHSADNLELAKQMTMNWCVSKWRKMGFPAEELQ